MSKGQIKKFRRSDYDDVVVDTRNKVNKSEQKRFDRALRTKDVSDLIDDEDDDPELWAQYYGTEER